MTDTRTIEDRWAAVDKGGEQPSLTGVTSHLAIRDGRATEAIDFYARAFGAAETMRLPADDGRRIMHAQLAINGGTLMMADDFPEYCGGVAAGAPAGVTLHLHVDDADRWYDRAVAAGATATMPLEDMFWGDRYGQLKDPFGHSWSIGATMKKGEQA